MQTASNTPYRIGRAFVGILFFTAGFIKITHYPMFLKYMASGGLPLAEVLLPLTIAMEIIGGLMLITGWKSIYAAAVLALFVIPTTLIFHDFWNADGPAFVAQLTSFVKNVAVFGGLAMVVARERASCPRAIGSAA
jgi:putative oxidoreductase